MSFRYKSALLSLGSMLFVYGWYFSGVFANGARALGAQRPGALIASIVLISIIQIVGHIMIAIASGKASLQLDEREYALELHATKFGYYALITGVFGVLPLLGLGEGRAPLTNAMLLLVVIAECIRQGTFLLRYHRPA